MKNAVTVVWGAALATLLLHCSSSSSSNTVEPVDSGESLPAADAGDAGAVPDEDASAAADAEAGPRAIPSTLSGYGLFTGGPDGKGHLTPVSGTISYELNSVLFSDYALKSRTITIPPGSKAVYQPESVLEFPVGTIFSKTFAFPADLRSPDVGVRVVETRILIHQPSGWEAYPYLWNDQQTEASLVPGGRVVKVSLVDLQGATQNFDYLVPSRNQCQQCHHLLDDAGKQVMHPIGPKARYLNRNNAIEGTEQNQLTYLANAGVLDGLPADPPRAPNALDPSTGDVESRARAYLDINCAHCHNTHGTAGTTSRLFLQHDMTDAFSLGVCKRPGSAGGSLGGEFDLLPGDHEHSILWNRIHTTESGKMMPQIGRALSHVEGVQLIAEWIDAMPSQTCQ
ncbi:hypothetical protein AKJ09_10608 [Labilithrix luteola]|uniref:Repeat protein (TIGR03806 family) n=1 Tax=Labilithrix luteola TaxID=1391654 RepID=A0A0K1QET3_9BACT|nr:SO2930 family diheme c-type cytochrome [Labilithrix luteola]AKV03945.1 hypothetical protein AKJ09_10608 [Labilithrix luteola]